MDNEQLTIINKINKFRYYVAACKELFNCLIVGIILGVLLLFCFLGVTRKQEISFFFANISNAAINLEEITKNSKKASEDLTIITNKSKVSADIILTVGNAKAIDNYIAVLDTNSQIVQDQIKTTLAESARTSREIREGLQPILQTTNNTILQGQHLLVELTSQIKNNGDSLNGLLNQGQTLVAKSEKELLETLANINKTTNGLQLLVNDQELANLIKNSSLTTNNIQIVTKELADLSTQLIEPIVRPRKTTGLNKYLLQPTLKILRIINGSTNIIYLISKVNQ